MSKVPENRTSLESKVTKNSITRIRVPETRVRTNQMITEDSKKNGVQQNQVQHGPSYFKEQLESSSPEQRLEYTSPSPPKYYIPKPIEYSTMRIKLHPVIAHNPKRRLENVDSSKNSQQKNSQSQPIQEVKEEPDNSQEYKFKSKRLQKKIAKLKQSKEKQKQVRTCMRQEVKASPIIFVGCLSGLRLALKTIFCLRTNSQTDLILTNEESRILSALYKKRFHVETGIEGIRSINYYLDLTRTTSTKRSEEIYKFLFKNAFKYLKSQFNAQNQLNTKKMTKEEKKTLFYEHYFKEASKLERKPIGNFYLPLTPSNIKTLKKVKISKTINNKYIALIFTSDLFVKDFREFIEKKLFEYCVDSIEQKIDNLVDKWEHMAKTHGLSLRIVDMICDDIQFNKKCKFPWSMNEMEVVMEEAQKLITKFG